MRIRAVTKDRRWGLGNGCGINGLSESLTVPLAVPSKSAQLKKITNMHELGRNSFSIYAPPFMSVS